MPFPSEVRPGATRLPVRRIGRASTTAVPSGQSRPSRKLARPQSRCGAPPPKAVQSPAVDHDGIATVPADESVTDVQSGTFGPHEFPRAGGQTKCPPRRRSRDIDSRATTLPLAPTAWCSELQTQNTMSKVTSSKWSGNSSQSAALSEQMPRTPQTTPQSDEPSLRWRQLRQPGCQDRRGQPPTVRFRTNNRGRGRSTAGD